MANGSGHQNGGVANRVASWATMAAIAGYVLYIGQWVGAADEKFKDAESVEQKQEVINDKVTRIETEVEHVKNNVEDVKREQAKQNEKLDAILRALERDTR